MKKRSTYKSMPIYLLAFTLIFLLSNTPSKNDSINRNIREKIKALPTFYSLNNPHHIYCAPLIKEVYSTNNYFPYWVDKKNIQEFITVIESCDEDGLHPEDYHLKLIHELRTETSPTKKASLDIILSDAFLLYIKHMLSGKVNPFTINAEWSIEKKDIDPMEYFHQLNSKSISEISHAISPQSKKYKILKEELLYYKSLAHQPQPASVLNGKTLKAGITDARISQVRETLCYYTNGLYKGTSNLEFYDDTLKQYIIAFQKLHGLEAEGAIGKQTIKSLNIPITDRIKTIEANLERLRWLPREMPNQYLMVNIANFELEVVEHNKTVRRHKVIVGKPYRQTPVFSSTMEYIVFNPTWTVPPTILKEDIIPDAAKNKESLVKKKINIYDYEGNQLNIDSIDWNSNRALTYTYRQESGRSNALGLVKFIFPNPFNIYLHDTPSKYYFSLTQRTYSSGCIRVEQPVELAAYLLRDQHQYNLSQIWRIIHEEKTKTILLKTKPRVYLIYLTAWANEMGEINFRKDIYNRDEKLITALYSPPISRIIN